MAPQDDLTAERAIEFLKKLGVYPWPYRIEQIIAHAKTARQEALREAKVIITQAATWTPQSVVAILDRLAREGVKG